MNLISLEDISLIIEKKNILNNININVKEKEIITVIGPNGSGKTSLMKIIAGIIKASKGKVNRSGNLRIGYVPQKFSINQNLPLKSKDFLKLYKYKDITEKRFAEIIDLLSLSNLLNTNLKELSGGELQRILIGRALLTKPNLMILDEPTQGLDIHGQEKLYELLDIFRDKFDTSIILVSHDLHFVMKATNQVICLNKHICCQGKPEEIDHKKILQEFGYGENMLPYPHHHNHTHNHF